MIGIYGGTFDPIHFGHISLALDMMEMHRLEEVWFCPVRISPHKLDQPPTSPEHRMAMLKLALSDIPKFRIIDVEINREGPSYTIDTLRDLAAIEAKTQSNKKFCLLLGDDALQSFCKWHQPEEIVKLLPIFIGRRQHSEVDCSTLNLNPSICAALKKGMTQTKLMEVSGTEIRKRLSKGQYCGHLLPAKVLDYIYANQLYF